jgi:hypothetical protein
MKKCNEKRSLVGAFFIGSVRFAVKPYAREQRVRNKPNKKGSRRSLFNRTKRAGITDYRCSMLACLWDPELLQKSLSGLL